MKGASGNWGPNGAFEAAQALEREAKEANLTGIDARFEKVKTELMILRRMLSKTAGGRRS